MGYNMHDNPLQRSKLDRRCRSMGPKHIRDPCPLQQIQMPHQIGMLNSCHPVQAVGQSGAEGFKITLQANTGRAIGLNGLDQCRPWKSSITCTVRHLPHMLHPAQGCPFRVFPGMPVLIPGPDPTGAPHRITAQTRCVPIYQRGQLVPGLRLVWRGSSGIAQQHAIRLQIGQWLVFRAQSNGQACAWRTGAANQNLRGSDIARHHAIG